MSGVLALGRLVGLTLLVVPLMGLIYDIFIESRVTSPAERRHMELNPSTNLAGKGPYEKSSKQESRDTFGRT